MFPFGHLGAAPGNPVGGAKRPYAGISPSKPCVAGVYLACRKTGRSSRLLADIPYGSARSGEIAGRFGDRGALNGSRLWPSIDMACSRIRSSCSFVRRPSPGRGSAAGSLVCFLSGITNIDPIKYGLLFERFLNPERVSMPDIDIDFCQSRRGEIIDYVVEKYGRYIFSTPGWHKIHHSDEQKFTDSHFGDVFTFWDRIFGTWHKVNPDEINYGLKEFDNSEKQTAGFLLRSPFIDVTKVIK